MEKFDDDIPQRNFDNFHKIMIRTEDEAIEFAKNALMEIPDQYEYIRNNLLVK